MSLSLKQLIFTYKIIETMKTIFTILIMVFGAFTVVTAQNKPQFQFESEVIDYGEIKKGSDGLRIFKFKNVGSAPLIIDHVYSSCGCAVPSWTKTPIAAGGTGEIQVLYNTDIVGPIRRTISINSNANEPTKAVKIKGKVVE